MTWAWRSAQSPLKKGNSLIVPGMMRVLSQKSKRSMRAAQAEAVAQRSRDLPEGIEIAEERHRRSAANAANDDRATAASRVRLRTALHNAAPIEKAAPQTTAIVIGTATLKATSGAAPVSFITKACR